MAETDGLTLTIRTLVFVAVAAVFYFVLKSEKKDKQD